VGAEPRGPEEHDGVVDAMLSESIQRLEILRENPERPSFLAFEELRIAVGKRGLKGGGARSGVAQHGSHASTMIGRSPRRGTILPREAPASTCYIGRRRVIGSVPGGS